MTVRALPKLLLANDAGGGRGHMTRLAGLGRLLADRFQIDAVVPQRDGSPELEAIGATVFRGPLLRFGAGRDKPAPCPSFGAYLAQIGFDSPDRLREVLDWWRKVLVSRDVSVLIADYAPMALLAAQGLRAEGWAMAIFTTGQGFGLPPWHLPSFPVLHPEVGEAEHSESVLLEIVNTVGGDFGLPPLAAFPEVFRADLSLVTSLPFLDPYAGLRRDPLVSPVQKITQAIGGGGDEVFLYFSTRELQNPELVAALAELPLPRRAFLPQASPEVAARLAAAGVMLESTPLDHDTIRARSRMLIHAGQHGSLCMGMFSGLPQVALPTDLERHAHAGGAQAAGGCVKLGPRGKSRDDFLQSFLTAYEDETAAHRATELADRLRADLPADFAADLRDRLRPACQAADVVI